MKRVREIIRTSCLGGGEAVPDGGGDGPDNDSDAALARGLGRVGDAP